MRGEVPEVIDQILRWGGIVDSSTLAQMRWPGRKSGQRSARELLSALADRSYVECVGRLGSRPLYAVSEAGYYVAAANAYMTTKWTGSPIRKNKAGVKVLPAQIAHTLAVASVTSGWVRRANELQGDNDDGAHWCYITPSELLAIGENREQVKVPDAIVARWMDGAVVSAFAVEVERSRKSGRLYPGRSNWASLARSIVHRYAGREEAWELPHPSRSMVSRNRLKHTALVVIDSALERPIHRHILEQMAASGVDEIKLVRPQIQSGSLYAEVLRRV